MVGAGNCDGEGQNAFMSMPAASGAVATDSWYAEIKDFDFASHRSRGETGHFTQLVSWSRSRHAATNRSARQVWHGTRRVGAAASPNGQYVVVLCPYRASVSVFVFVSVFVSMSLSLSLILSLSHAHSLTGGF